MATRKIVVVGDKTTTGGVILPNVNSTFSLGDAAHKAALIGGPVQCPACKSNGVIAKAGGPRRMNFMGEVALENDIVLCGCSTPPKLVADLHHTMTCDDEAASSVSASPAAFRSGAGSLTENNSSQVSVVPAKHVYKERVEESWRLIDRGMKVVVYEESAGNSVMEVAELLVSEMGKVSGFSIGTYTPMYRDLELQQQVLTKITDYYEGSVLAGSASSRPRPQNFYREVWHGDLVRGERQFGITPILRPERYRWSALGIYPSGDGYFSKQ